VKDTFCTLCNAYFSIQLVTIYTATAESKERIIYQIVSGGLQNVWYRNNLPLNYQLYKILRTIHHWEAWRVMYYVSSRSSIRPAKRRSA